MDQYLAITKINQLTYKPGWMLYARGSQWLDEDEVWVDVSFDTVNSNREYAPTYPQAISAGTSVFVKTSGTWEQVRARVFEKIMAIELHEAREFFRDGAEAYAAPFHPHRLDTEDQFRSVFGARTLINVKV